MSGLAGIIFPLLFLFFATSAIFLIAAPFAVSMIAFYLLRRRGKEFKPSVIFSVIPILLLLAWPLSGLFNLGEKCDQTSLVRFNSEKLGPIDALLIDGPGMWWLNGKIDVERPEYGNANLFRIREAKQENKKRGSQPLSETELRSRYKVTIEQPQGGNFLQRYLTTASIKIEDRATKAMVASIQESVWGGGLAGSYIAALSKLNPFYSSNRYLSCGYAGQEIGIFRGDSKQRSQLYRAADQGLIEQVFILATNN